MPSEKPTACTVPGRVYELIVSGFAVSSLLVTMHGAAGFRTSQTCTMLKSTLWAVLIARSPVNDAPFPPHGAGEPLTASRNCSGGFPAVPMSGTSVSSFWNRPP